MRNEDMLLICANCRHFRLYYILEDGYYVPVSKGCCYKTQYKIDKNVNSFVCEYFKNKYIN